MAEEAQFELLPEFPDTQVVVEAPNIQEKELPLIPYQEPVNFSEPTIVSDSLVTFADPIVVSDPVITSEPEIVADSLITSSDSIVSGSVSTTKAIDSSNPTELKISENITLDIEKKETIQMKVDEPTQDLAEKPQIVKTDEGLQIIPEEINEVDYKDVSDEEVQEVLELSQDQVNAILEKSDKLSSDSEICDKTTPEGLCEKQKMWWNLFREHLIPNEKFLRLLKKYKVYDEIDWQKNFKQAVFFELFAMDASFISVADMINSAHKKELKTMILTDIILTQIPPIVSILSPHLNTLVISEMDLHSLPEEISQLVNLTQFTITKTPIHSLPENIGNLSNLTVLQISRTRIQNLPSTIIKCSKLEVLDLSYNLLIEPLIRDILNSLNELQRLYLDGNPSLETETLPDIPKLLHLSISQTKIKTLPKELINHLQSLSWWGCNLAELPESFGENLKHLNLARNQIEKLPSMPASLTYLNLVGNKISDSTLLSSLANIRTLLLQDNPFK